MIENRGKGQRKCKPKFSGSRLMNVTFFRVWMHSRLGIPHHRLKIRAEFSLEGRHDHAKLKYTRRSQMSFTSKHNWIFLVLCGIFKCLSTNTTRPTFITVRQRLGRICRPSASTYTMQRCSSARSGRGFRGRYVYTRETKELTTTTGDWEWKWRRNFSFLSTYTDIQVLKSCSRSTVEECFDSLRPCWCATSSLSFFKFFGSPFNFQFLERETKANLLWSFFLFLCCYLLLSLSRSTSFPFTTTIQKNDDIQELQMLKRDVHLLLSNWKDLTCPPFLKRDSGSWMHTTSK